VTESGAEVLDLRLRVLDWEAWAPGLEAKHAWRAWAATGAGLGHPDTAAPSAAAVAPLLRRRAGLSDRLALELAWRLAPGGGDLPCVFASRHGQIVRSVGLLQAVAEQAPLSPMDFSVSVHNATAGLYTISAGDRAPASAVAGGLEALGGALLDAQGRIEEGAERVLVVYHDEAPPAVLDGRWDGEAAGWALGLLLGRAPGPCLRMGLRDLGGDAAAGAEGPDPDEAQALALARLLARGSGAARWRSGRHLWLWAFQE
jgi:hypothetical protein